MLGKCPKCDAAVSRAIVNTIDLEVIGGANYLGLNYSCPHCHTTLGVQMDPIALKSDTVTEMAAFLRKG